MTRFARAKGSKASNEKAPEDGTPWEVMKEQLLQAKKESEDAKNREQAEKQRIENYENFLKEHKVQKRKATWCDFPEDDTIKKQNTSIQNGEPCKKSKKKNKQNNNENGTELLEVVSKPTSADNNVHKTKKKNKKKNKQISELETPQSDNKAASQESQPNAKKNKKNKVLPNVESETQDNDFKTLPQVTENLPNRKKKNKKGKLTSEPDISNHNQEENNDKSFQVQAKNNNTFDGKQNQKNKKQKKNKKLVDGQPIRRKVVDDKSFQLIINGKEVELVRFDGFPIMKKDAERLQELKDSMIKKGIPKSEVQRTMKLERRRAEKALARVRREVCYNCRKGGHNLSDCPELKSKIPGADAPDGVCFKCGSTEHRQFECKVQRDKEFRFATCFICKEPGHIARQCPDNPKGLYPNGGSCKLCGDVTHLRKDCPTANDKKEGTAIKLQTLDASEYIEEIGQQSKNTNSEGASRKPKKITF